MTVEAGAIPVRSYHEIIAIINLHHENNSECRGGGGLNSLYSFFIWTERLVARKLKKYKNYGTSRNGYFLRRARVSLVSTAKVNGLRSRVEQLLVPAAVTRNWGYNPV